MAALAARNWLSTTISGRQGHSGGMPEWNDMELISRHAGQPGAAGDLRGGQLSGPENVPHSPTLTLCAPAPRRLDPFSSVPQVSVRYSDLLLLQLRLGHI